jgi:putative oxidoreductase
MNISECKKWIESHPFLPLDLVRVYLGVGLFVKGLFFLQHPEILSALEKNHALPHLPISAGTCVLAAHLLGGALLAVGLFTRAAAFLQVPVFYGALIYVYMGQVQTLESRQGFEFTGLVLFLSLLLGIFGAGPWSLDHRLFQKRGKPSNFQAHPDLFLDIVRSFLGVALFVKAIFFMEHRELLIDLVETSGSWQIFPLAAIHYVIPAHLAGGIFLMIGLFTRIAALVQLPLLAGAVLYLYLPKLVAVEGRQDFEFTSLVLFLVTLVLVYGPGRWSVDHILAKAEMPQLAPKPVV